MMDNKNQQQGNVCNCGMCGGGCGCGHHYGHGLGFMIFRCLLAIIIAIGIFAIGVRIGELRGLYEGSGYLMERHMYYTYPMMMGGTNVQYGAPMMPATSSASK